MNVIDDQANAALLRLIYETISKHISSTVTVARIEPIPIAAGMSGASVQRYRIFLNRAMDGQESVSLVTKEANLVERRVLALLNEQKQPNVPFSHTLDLTTDAPALVCLQDLGDEHRPSSRDVIAPKAIRQEAQGLAFIHHANHHRTKQLAWLPRADRQYIVNNIMNTFWKPAWDRAIADPAFVRQFAPCIESVEDAAGRIADEMERLYQDSDTLTLVHCDVNPSNVLLHAGTPYFIDWQDAHHGSFYLDLPHHLAPLGRVLPYSACGPR